MDDNILLEPASTSSSSKREPEDGPVKDGVNSLSNGIGGNQKWIPTHIIDFSDLSIGEHNSSLLFFFNCVRMYLCA